MSKPIESPCIGLCQLDGTNTCKGCFRTIEEIILWPDATPDMRQHILKKAGQRKTRQTA